MERKNLWLMIGGMIVIVLYIFLSLSIKDTASIWILTRIFGLIAFLALATTIILGELRLLHLMKSDFTLFRFHVPIAIFSIFLVMLHGISALADNYKWGVSLVWTQYLGFNFSDHWLIYLSFGTLAFYAMFIVGMSSMNSFIQKIGYKNWKLIHYLSYGAFFIAFFHSVNLGTDLKNGFSVMTTPIFFLLFIAIFAMLLVRIIKTSGIFEEQKHVYAYIAIMAIVVAIAFFFVAAFLSQQEEVASLQLKAQSLADIATVQDQIIQDTTTQIVQIQAINNNTGVLI